MDIRADFLKTLVSVPKLSSGCKPETFLGQLYSQNADTDFPFWKILSGGTLKVFSPWSFDIRFLDCYMLLYTKAGCGKLLINGQVHTLTESSLLFFDCHQRFRIDIAIEPWEYGVLFITGQDLSAYYAMLPKERAAIMPLSPYSEPALCFDRLLALRKDESFSAKLTVSSLLNSIITECVKYQLAAESTTLPAASYLMEMKELFDDHFQENYSLDDLEERFHVSKYKLCREFSAAFDSPPLKYLNRKRIEYAKHLLLTTSLKVHEVGSLAGIDNTNHFISLFKKLTGTTPLEFKQKGH